MQTTYNGKEKTKGDGMREMICRHAKQMEYKLNLNEQAKGDSWKKMSIDWLLDKLNEELMEFRCQAIKDRPHIVNLALEAADVSNILMFIVENAHNKWAEESAEKVFGKDHS